MEDVLKNKIKKIVELNELLTGVNEQLRWLSKDEGGIITSERVRKGIPVAHDKIKTLAIETYNAEVVRIETELAELVK